MDKIKHNTVYDIMLYQAYIDTIQYHLEKNTGWIQWTLLRDIKEAPGALSLIDSRGLHNNLPDYFDFMISIMKNNSYWLFLLNQNNDILEGKHRVSALKKLLKHNIIGEKTKLLTSTMTHEQNDHLLTVFIPSTIPASYFESFNNSILKDSPVTIDNTSSQFITYNNNKYSLQKMTVFNFMYLYNLILRDYLIDNQKVPNNLCLQSVAFDYTTSIPNSIAKITELKKNITDRYVDEKFWVEQANTEDKMWLYKYYYDLVSGSEHRTNQHQQTIYRDIPYSEINNKFGRSEVKHSPFNWFANLSHEEKRKLVNVVAKHNFPFVIFLQSTFKIISPLSQAVMDLITYGINLQKISPDIKLKIIMIEHGDMPDVVYRFPNFIPTPRVVPLSHYFTDWSVYDWHYEHVVIDDKPMTELSVHAYFMALYWYEYVLWNNIEDISKLDKRLESIVRS